MKVTCGSCGARFKLDDSRIPAQGLAMKCPKCQAPLTIRREAEAEPAPAPVTPAPLTPPAPPPVPVSPAPAAAPDLDFGGELPPPDPFAELPDWSGPNAKPSDLAAPPTFDESLAAFDPALDMPAPAPTAPKTPPTPPAADFDFAAALADFDDDLLVDHGQAAPAPAAKAPKSQGYEAPVFDAPLQGEIQHGFDDLFAAPSAPAAAPAPKAASEPAKSASMDDLSLDLSGLFDAVDNTTPTPPPAPPSAGIPTYGELDLLGSQGGLELPPLDTEPAVPAPNASQTAMPLTGLSDLDGVEKVVTYQVRRPNGKTFGPFPAATVLDMLNQGKLSGDEEIAPTGGDWQPISKVPPFSDIVVRLSQPAASAQPSLATEKQRVQEESHRRHRLGQDGVVSPMKVRRFNIRWGIAIPVALGVLVVAVLGWLQFVEEISLLDLVMGTSVSDKPLMDQLKSRHRKIADQIETALERDNFKSLLESRDLALDLLKSPDFRGVGAVWALLAQVDYNLLWRYGAQPDLAQEAKNALDRVGETKRDDPELLFARAHGFLFEKKYGQARDLLQKLVMSDGKNVRALHLMAEVQLFLPDKGNANALLDQVIAQNKGSARTYYLQGRLLAAQNQIPKARAAFSKALELDAEHIDAQIERAGLALNDPEGARRAESDLGAIRNTFKDRLAKKQLARIHYYSALIAKAGNEPYKVVKELASAIDNQPDYFVYNRTLGEFYAEKHEYEKAQEQFTKCVENNAEEIACRLMLARMLLVLTHPDQALFKLDEAAKIDPKNAQVAFLMGQTYEALFQPQKALDAYEKAIQLDNNGVEYYTSAALLYMKQDNMTKAGEYVQKARLIDADSPKVHIFLGLMYLHQNDKDKAIESFSNAIKANPKEKDAHLALADLYREVGRFDDAIRSYQEVLAIDDKNDAAYYGLGRTYFEQKDFDRAITEYEKALALNNRNVEYTHFAGVAYYTKGDLEKAQASFQNALTLRPGYSEASFYLGRLFMDTKQYDKAAERFDVALQAEPKNPKYLLYTGWLLEKQDKFGDALDYYERALNEKKDYAEAYLRMGVALRAQNKFQDAIKKFLTAQKVDPTIMSARIELGDCYFEMRDYKAAVVQYQEAIRMDPKAPEAYRKLGLAFNELSQPAKAVQQLQRAVELDREDPAAHLGLGYAYKALKRKPDAMKEFETYLDLNPQALDRKEVQDEIYYLKNR